MDLIKLCNKHSDLIRHMQTEGYSKNYIRRLKSEINWIKKNKEKINVLTYEDIYHIRAKLTESSEMKRWYRLAYGVLKRFEEYNDYPDRRRKEPLIKRGSYSSLNPVFKEIIDIYKKSALDRNLKEITIYGNASGGACFLLAMQNKGCISLEDITEDDVMSFFIDSEGSVNLSSSYKKQIAAIFKSGLGLYTSTARCILSFLPMIRPKRKNVQYLTPEEIDCIHEILTDEDSKLSLRNRAIGRLLFFTGIRGCDIAAMRFSDIDWEKDEIRLNQQKTDGKLVLPLTGTIGNAIFDYITKERQESLDSHIFLSEKQPYDPVKAKSIYSISSKVYDAAEIRENHDDRRGTHLFRYNLATSLTQSGIARPVISEILGHTDPNSLDYYLFADIKHLRECALSIAKFPVNEEVFNL